MRKGLIVLLAVVLAAAFALPAMAADIKASGFYRSKAWMGNFHDGSGAPSLRTDQPGDEAQTNAFVEQRFRVKFDFGDENVKAVWYLESDMYWGDSGGSSAPNPARNSGGALGADKVQMETKNIYVWFKVPDTSIDVTVGLQGQSDAYAGVLYGGADMAGIFLNGKYEPVKYTLGWAKLYENTAHKTDDMTLYVARADFVPAKDAKLGVNFYFLQDDSAKNTSATALPSAVLAGEGFKGKVYMPGIDGTFKAGPATITGFLQYQTGKYEPIDPTASSVDVSAYLVDLRADMAVGPGKMFIEGLYLSGGDNPDDKYKAPITLATRESSPGGNSSYTRTNMAILLASPDTIGVSQCLIGCSGGESGSDPGNGGRGITHFAAGYAQNLNAKTKIQANVGYLAATKKLVTDTTVKGKDMGTEINARVDYNIVKGLDVGLVAAYAFIGDFYNSNVAGSNDIEDAYTTYARINYSF